MELTRDEILLIRHRLDSGCVEEVLAEEDVLAGRHPRNFALHVSCLSAAFRHGTILGKTFTLPKIFENCELCQMVLIDCLNGSTWFAAMISNGTPILGLWERVADGLEIKFQEKYGKRIGIPRF